MSEIRTIPIKVDHLKCEGCTATIIKEISRIKGVLSVSVNMEEKKVIVALTGVADLKMIKKRLKKLGYPESGTTQGLEKLTANAKSYASCALGRITKSDSIHTN